MVDNVLMGLASTILVSMSSAPKGSAILLTEKPNVSTRNKSLKRIQGTQKATTQVVKIPQTQVARIQTPQVKIHKVAAKKMKSSMVAQLAGKATVTKTRQQMEIRSNRQEDVVVR